MTKPRRKVRCPGCDQPAELVKIGGEEGLWIRLCPKCLPRIVRPPRPEPQPAAGSVGGGLRHYHVVRRAVPLLNG
jgi:hypothetical protein